MPCEHCPWQIQKSCPNVKPPMHSLEHLGYLKRKDFRRRPLCFYFSNFSLEKRSLGWALRVKGFNVKRKNDWQNDLTESDGLNYSVEERKRLSIDCSTSTSSLALQSHGDSPLLLFSLTYQPLSKRCGGQAVEKVHPKQPIKHCPPSYCTCWALEARAHRSGTPPSSPSHAGVCPYFILKWHCIPK